MRQNGNELKTIPPRQKGCKPTTYPKYIEDDPMSISNRFEYLDIEPQNFDAMQDSVYIPTTNSQILNKTSKIYGSLPINPILYVLSLAVLLTPLYTYYMATIKQKVVPPFPHTTITDTACPYPQDIAFRLNMGFSTSIFSLMYYVLFRWMKYQSKRIRYPGKIHYWMLYLGQTSVLGFLAAIGTIDSGGYPALHTIGAVFFFIVLMNIVIYTTITLKDMHNWDPTVLSPQSNLVKILLTTYIQLLSIFCIIALLLQNQKQLSEDPKYVVIMEWNLTFVCMIWMLSFRRDFKGIRLVLCKQKNQ